MNEGYGGGQGLGARPAFPKPGRALIVLMAANVALYVVELILMRLGVTAVSRLFLTPSDVFQHLFLWQPLTYSWFHAPDAPFHLLLNMLWLYLFGAPLEAWWGQKRFVTAYFIFALSGAVFTLMTALSFDVLGIVPSFWVSPHLGASAAVMGMTVAWGLAFANQEMHFFLLGRMKGKTFVLILVAVELLTALSFSGVSSTSHFGGIVGAVILCRGLWKPAKVRSLVRNAKLRQQKKKLETELRLIQGGQKFPDDKSEWN